MKPHNTFLLSETPSKTAFSDNRQFTENNNQLSPNGQEKTLKELWSKHKMKMSQSQIKSDPTAGNFDNIKMTWEVEKAIDTAVVPEVAPMPEKLEKLENLPAIKREIEDVQEQEQSTKEESPSHHARRPPNAFLIFCKKHRPIVRDRFPNLENRGVTKILGEWWALLNNVEKLPYNDLAKEYKDAFLSANPDFRWYKLPAPPLRTLSTRPLTFPKPHPSISSPSSAPTTTTVTSALSEFTPGKLADESQLGGLTSLMNNFVSMPKTEPESNNNIPKMEEALISPVNTIIVSMPPKPIKKRFVEYHEVSIKGCARSILNDEDVTQDSGNAGSQTNEDCSAKYQDDSSDQNGTREPRKSERMCKGKRYEIFMLEGKLLGNKRETSKFVQQRQTRSDTKMEIDLNSLNNNNNNNNIKPETPKLDLGNTIKRLAERTNIKIDFDIELREPQVEVKRERSISETSESGGKTFPPNFNLDLRISNLPSLSYDEFWQRKRDSKKRKARTKSEGEHHHRKKVQKLNKDSQLVGSKKRKNKQSITHLGNKGNSSGISGDLIGLATLAEVAANTEKINEKISE